MASLISPLFCRGRQFGFQSVLFRLFGKTFHPAMEFNTKVRRINARKTYGLSRLKLREGKGGGGSSSQAGRDILPQGQAWIRRRGAKGASSMFPGGLFGVRFLEEGKVPERSPPYLHPQVRMRPPRLSFRPCRSVPSPSLRPGLPIFPFRRRTIFPLAKSPSSCGARTKGFGLVSVDPTNTGRSPPCRTHPFPMSYPSCVGQGWKQAFFSQDRNENERSTSHESGRFLLPLRARMHCTTQEYRTKRKTL